MDNILDRIRWVMVEKRISQRAMAAGLKLSLPTINKLLRSDGNIGLHTIKKIANFLKVHENWLITGTGEKHVKTEDELLVELEDKGENEVTALNKVQVSLSVQELQVKNQSLEEEIRRLRQSFNNTASDRKDSFVEFVDLNTSLVYPDRHTDSEFLSTLPLFSLPSNRFINGPFRAFEISGDVMARKINNGDWVICRKVENISTIKDLYVYVLVLEDEIECRRVLNRLEERGKLRLKADNPSFSDLEIGPEQIKEVWEVKSIMSFKLNNPDFEVNEWVKRLEDRVFELSERVERIESKN